MGNFIPVEPEKWAEMVKAAASSDYWRIEAETDHARWLRTLEENEKLRAEVERLQHLANQSEFYRSQLQKDTCRLENIQMQDAFKHYEAENARLKADVERLKNNCDCLDRELDREIDKTAMLCGQVERLRKAGDAMEADLRFIVFPGAGRFQCLKEWNAAKEGKPQP